MSASFVAGVVVALLLVVVALIVLRKKHINLNSKIDGAHNLLGSHLVAAQRDIEVLRNKVETLEQKAFWRKPRR